MLAHFFQFIQLLSRWARFDVTVTLQEKQKKSNKSLKKKNEGYDRLSFKTN